MGVEEVYDIIHDISEGFEPACVQCLQDNSGTVLEAVKEQLYSGLDADGKHLSPTYDDDPYFNEKGPWMHRASAYKKWKEEITPPKAGEMLGLPPRPVSVPNLYINGKFYSEITAMPNGAMLTIDPGIESGPDIVSKYGERILGIGPSAVEYFNRMYMLPAIEELFRNCGYQ